MQSKLNVQAFNADVAIGGGYRYSDSSLDIAKRFSNSRTSRAIADAAVFTGKRVIDIGCGDGTFTVELGGLGIADLVGVDPAEQAVVAARARAAAAGLTARFETISVYDLTPAFGRFDIAVVRGVLHHLPDPAAALKAIAGIADEIVVIEPNGCNPVLKLIERFSAYHVAHEEQSFLPWTIDRWLKQAGKTPWRGEVINLVPLFCPPWFARVLKALEPIVERMPMVRLFGCGQYVVHAA